MFASARGVCRRFNRFSPLFTHTSKTKVNGDYVVRCLYVFSAESHRWPCAYHTGVRSIFPLSKNLFCDGVTQTRLFNTSTVLFDSHVVKTPPFAESVTEGDVRWDKAVGDTVEMDEVIGEIETDKTSIPIHAPVAGVIEAILVQDGDKVVAEQELCRITVSGDAPAKPKPAADTPPAAAPTPAAAAPAPAKPVADVSGSIPTSPPPVPPIPTAAMKSIPTSAVKVTPVVGQAAPATLAPSRTEQRVKMTRMRQRIAQRLKDAQNTCAMLTTFNEIDMSHIMELRAKYKDAFIKKHNVKLGFMSAFIKASAAALTDQPVVNAVIDDLEIVYRNYIDISVAVATPKGLVVPVLRDVGNMNYAEIEKGLNELGEKARTGNLAIEDMDGGTFTISNGGVFGSLLGTPIINPPQSAILGMHGIFDRPVAIKGQVQIRPMMYVALTYDHRLIDGREAATFLRKIKSFVEDPQLLLLDL